MAERKAIDCDWCDNKDLPEGSTVMVRLRERISAEVQEQGTGITVLDEVLSNLFKNARSPDRGEIELCKECQGFTVTAIVMKLRERKARKEQEKEQECPM
jgi:hypothetical protein